MVRHFVELVNEAVNEGYHRGVGLFMETLEYDLTKDAIYEAKGIRGVVTDMFENAGIYDNVPLDSKTANKLDKITKKINKLNR